MSGPTSSGRLARLRALLDPDRAYRAAERWTGRRRLRIAGHNPAQVGLRTAKGVVDDRAVGLAAEMAFFALLSLVPFTIALGAGLGELERVIDPATVDQLRASLVAGARAAFAEDVAEGFLVPLVSEVLDQERGGVAIGGLAISLVLSSRVFGATIRALDQAYGVAEPRGLLGQRLRALLISLAAVIAVVVTVALMVVGPLLGGGRMLAERLGLGTVFETAWALGRWPVLLLVVAAFLTMIYRVGPNTSLRLRHCVPGAALGVGLWLAVSLGFRVWLAFGGDPAATDVLGPSPVDQVVTVVGVIAALMMWVLLSSLAILVGGELNVQLSRSRAERDATG